MILFNCEVSRCLRYSNDLEMWNKETYELIFGDNLIRNRDLIENVENSRRRRPRKKIGFAVLFHLWNRSNSRPDTCFLVPEVLQAPAPDWSYSRQITFFSLIPLHFQNTPPPPPTPLRPEQPWCKESSGIVSYAYTILCFQLTSR